MNDADVHTANFTGYDVVRIFLGLLLLTAAGLKVYQLATEPVVGLGLLHSGWLLIGVVQFELLLGLWLLAGILPKATWRFALACFVCFGGVSLFKALSGEASCGCFGKVPVNPWYTFALDLAAVVSLLYWRPNGHGATAGRSVRSLPFRVGGVALAGLLVGVPWGLVMGSHSAATLSDTGEVLGDSEFVVLEPEKWIVETPLVVHLTAGKVDRVSKG